ncbi:dipeptide ABC transporter periplasmic protein [Bradyrhizobium lupini HPC(L)]|uniref:Dipeptide ABC transporter periplasmic protein n=1 Tax=Bradyrhizobium lupini HPC(L) TaxID=1229491 RepID=A0ABP2RQN6_RHILU|nr:dipeptide ABC transporter periplasmic protein [Bradyrhizobium lupini HPC(L)]
MNYRFSPRRFGLSGALLATALACSTANVWAADYKQAPMLDEQVEGGKLPAVAERLPEAPFVETVVDGVGKYGGTLRTTILANADEGGGRARRQPT